MRLFYYRVTSNFGDHMNAWLWPRLIPSQLAADTDDTLVGIGSLIKADLGKVPGRKLIFGTGSGYGAMPWPSEIANWRVYCVRGPLTARLLGLSPDKAIVDGAWLVDQLPDYCYRPERTRAGTVFVPHWTTDLYANWRQPCADAGIGYVSPFQEGKVVLAAIAGAKQAIVESLHGAIMADYYRVPWIPVATDDRVLDFKWLDFCMSVDLPFRPIRLPVTDAVERIFVRRPKPWSGGIEYLREPVESDFIQLPKVKQTPITLRYRTMIQVKNLARPLRSAALGMVGAARNSAPLRKAFAGESARLAGLLSAIVREPAYLSSDAVRQERIDQLAATLEQFRTDFPAK